MRASRKALPGKGYRIEATIGGKSVELPMQVYVSDARDKKKLAEKYRKAWEEKPMAISNTFEWQIKSLEWSAARRT